MALLRRLMRHGGLLGLTKSCNTECGIAFALRYASDSKKPGESPETPAYPRKQKAAGSKKEGKGAPKDKEAASAASAPASTAAAAARPESAKPPKVSPAAAATEDAGYSKKNTAEPAGKQPLEKDPQTSPAASASSDGNVPPAAESKPVPAENDALEEVGYAPKRRTMPLPEDRPVAEVEESESPQVKRAAPRRVFVPTAMDYDYTLPLPKIIKVVATKEKKELVSLGEAIRLVKKSPRRKFLETVEVHIQLGVDPKRSDQIVRGAVTLPYGSGKVVKVAVFADGLAAEEALAAGADVVGTDDLVEKVLASGGKLDFDKCIAIPSVMPKLGKIARILGPRGLMPNPKMGSVTVMVADAVRAAKQGRVDFRADKTAIVHAGLGKVNFPEEHLYQNISAFCAAVLAAKPAGFKKSSRYTGFFDKFYVCSTMGSGIPVTIQSVATASDNYIKSQAAAEAA